MPQRSSNKTLWIVLSVVLGLCCLLLIGGGWFLWSAAKQAIPLASCSIKMQDVRTAVKMYADDNGGTLPKAETWEDDIQSQLGKVASMSSKEKNPFGTVVPGETLGCKFDDRMTGIYFNDEVSGKKLSDVPDKFTTVLLFQAKDQKKNGHGKYDPTSNAGIKIFGQEIGGIVVPLEGDADLVTPDGKRTPIRRS